RRQSRATGADIQDVDRLLVFVLGDRSAALYQRLQRLESEISLERRPNAVGRRWPLSTHRSRMRRIDERSAMGHEERFPPTRLSARCGFRKETIADRRAMSARCAAGVTPPMQHG